MRRASPHAVRFFVTLDPSCAEERVYLHSADGATGWIFRRGQVVDIVAEEIDSRSLEWIFNHGALHVVQRDDQGRVIEDAPCRLRKGVG